MDNNLEYFLQQATIKREQEDYQGALNDYNQIIQLESENESHYFHRGQIWMLIEDFPQAIKDFQQAIKLNPTEPSAYNFLGLTLELLEKIEEAIEAYTQGIEIQSVPEADKQILYGNRATAYDKINNLQAALEDFNKAIEINQKDVHPYHLLRGKIRRKLGDMHGAEADLNEADRIMRDSSSGQLSIGKMYDNLGMKKKAIEHYQKAAEIAAKDGDAVMQQAMQKILQGFS
ncbi:MAG: tetratricopeptide repeat protein [Cyanobacteriota bacterium]|nr:tetratricopeptide repeat protein [Cyanobacteriota bacterium]